MSTYTSNRAGYALLLALVALVALTLLGLAALSIADVDLAITHNIRRYHQVYAGANAGLDHARDLSKSFASNPQSITAMNVAVAGGGCQTVVDASTNPPATPLETGGYATASYSVERCYGECGGVPRGFEATAGINQGGGGDQLQNVYLDMVSLALDDPGGDLRSEARATTAGFLRILGYCY